MNQTSIVEVFPTLAVTGWQRKTSASDDKHTVQLNKVAIRANKPKLVSEIKTGSFPER